jgi:hypothetical protein
MAAGRMVIKLGMQVGKSVSKHNHPMAEGSTVEQLRREMVALGVFEKLWKQKGDRTEDSYVCFDVDGETELDASAVLTDGQQILVKWLPRANKKVDSKKPEGEKEEGEDERALAVVPKAARKRTKDDDEWMLGDVPISTNDQYDMANAKLVAWRAQQSRLRKSGKPGDLERLQQIDKMYGTVLAKIREYRPTYKSSVGEQFADEADAFTAGINKDLNKLHSKVVRFAARSTTVVQGMEDPEAAQQLFPKGDQKQPLPIGDAASSSRGFSIDAAEWEEFQAFKRFKAAQAAKAQKEE